MGANIFQRRCTLQTCGVSFLKRREDSLLRSLVRLRSLTRKVLANCSRAAVFVGVREARMGLGARAGGPPREAEHIRQPVLDGRGGQDELELGVDLADAGADDGILALHLDAFVNGAGRERILAEIGERRGIDALDLKVRAGLAIGPQVLPGELFHRIHGGGFVGVGFERLDVLLDVGRIQIACGRCPNFRQRTSARGSGNAPRR